MFSQNDLNYLEKFLTKDIPNAMILDVRDEIVKNASRELNVNTGELSDKNNWAVSGNGRTYLISSKNNIPYANIQNEGGNILVSEKMKNFFWMKFKTTGNSKWKGMALSKVLKIKPTSFAYVDVDFRRSRRLLRLQTQFNRR